MVDQKENKNTKNRFFFSVNGSNQKKKEAIIGVFKTTKISEEILVINKMSVYLGYNEVTKQYLGSIGRGTSASSGSNLNINGFTMSGDINMGGHEVIGLDDPSSDSSAANKKYVDDEVAKITTSGG